MPLSAAPPDSAGPAPEGPGALDAARATTPYPGDPDTPGWRRPPLTPDQLRGDVLVAVCMFVTSLLSMVLWQTAGTYEDAAPGWVSVLCLAAVILPLSVRRRWPSWVLLAMSAAFIVMGSLTVPEMLISNIALFSGFYTVGAWEPNRRRATWVRGVVVAAMFVWLLLAMFMATSDPDAVPELSRAGALSPLVAYMLIQLLTNVLYFAGAYWFGDRTWSSARERARTQLRTYQLERERRRLAAQAVQLERLRLARELHDAVAHHVSMMGVQAAAARTVLDTAAEAGTGPERARAMLEQVEDSAREAIEELRTILGTLREEAAPDDGADGAASAGPAGGGAPDEGVGSLGVERLPELVAGAREAGLTATFQVVGEPARLPRLTSLNLYRIAQEALTNTRKHAGASARADVRLRYLPDAVELEVTDDGVGLHATTTTQGAGLGLVGIRERVAAEGGTLEARPRGRGGFLVRATIPVERSGGTAVRREAGRG